ncbi:RNA-binding (RRM/RBD/RNP motifs) family protein [Zea mays]|uniref:RNA-binding (RRM/RBD/RNP motifs) family protein n=1 Tax=Zea mays TaxID=4577 RepID=A0A1D6GWH2_MAIZE|nr:RNA-binding (RRM/RBD/RNP motifs) family protein [Zea mays]
MSSQADSPRRRYSRSPSYSRGHPKGRSRSQSPARSQSRSPVPDPRSQARSRSRSQEREEDAVNRGNTLYVTGLSSRVTERDVKDYFSKHGRVVGCHVVLEPHTRVSRGFAFVSMDTVEEAERCIKYLNGSVMEGRNITVEKKILCKLCPAVKMLSSPIPALAHTARSVDSPKGYHAPQDSQQLNIANFQLNLSIHLQLPHQLINEHCRLVSQACVVPCAVATLDACYHAVVAQGHQLLEAILLSYTLIPLSGHRYERRERGRFHRGYGGGRDEYYGNGGGGYGYRRSPPPMYSSYRESRDYYPSYKDSRDYPPYRDGRDYSPPHRDPRDYYESRGGRGYSPPPYGGGRSRRDRSVSPYRMPERGYGGGRRVGGGGYDR